MTETRKVFDDLTKDELLRRCVGGYTQNPNEGFNSILWQYCPKAKFFGRKSVEVAANEAVIHFNEGQSGNLNVLRAMGVEPGKYFADWAKREDESRCNREDVKATDASKEARMLRKQARLAKEREVEDKTYEPGAY